jgi:hypothetical protein
MKRLALSALVLLAMSITAFAGSGGEKENVTSVAAYGSDRYESVFFGGEVAIITVQGDGDTDLDLFVYDDSGSLVISDEGSTDVAGVSFVPAFTRNYTVLVKNLGGVYNVYTIRTN